ncbi:hypothetical protein GCM10007886_43230 [Methylobacterium gregans]|uniref:AsmA-like C-terminal region-containing protein n=1 Tax=Methylobacterium gregans TaxID=374424 RepID=UPI00235BBE4D|nr:AsmA-like C-terminal region-containing protein [Methylobacterium gregans]GLS56138.1 hypothetical protein GCM10007886_43230 [Methylobacterium gregans]
MRDLLTALAGAVILVLVAALAAPPLIDWTAHRALVDRAIGRSLGLPARSEGRLDVRLLPSPRLRLDRLRIGGADEAPGLDARFVKAEIALTPLLGGEIRFTETRVGRAEVRLPVTGGEALLLPPGLGEAGPGRDLAIEDLQIQQFLLTTTVPATGRTDQLYAEDLRLQAPALAGPWRVEGTSAGVPFRLASGEVGADGSLPVKLSGGGDTRPRFEADARLSLVPAPGRSAGSGGRQALAVQAEGSARLVVGPPTQAAGDYLPFTLGGRFRAQGSQVRFETVTAEIDPAGRPLRLSGSGRLDLRQWRAGLSLEARRLDLDAFLLSGAGRALIARGLPKKAPGLPVLLDLDLAVESLALGLEEWSDLALVGTLDRAGGLVLRSFRATAPGAAALTASGTLEVAPAPHFNGPVTLSAPRSEGFGRYLGKLGLDGPAVAVLDGRPVAASATVSAAAATLSLSNLDLTLGTARLTGLARYTAPEGPARGRFEAQIAARGLDIAALPPLGGTVAELRGHDLGLTLEARDVRYGQTGSGAGTIAARIASDGPSLVVDTLEIRDLAGANATLAGRIGPDGAGKVSGRLTAPVAAPLIALLDRVWTGETRLIPAFLRAGALDLAVALEREAGSSDALRASARGSVAGSNLDLSLTSRAGRIDRAEIGLVTPRAGSWFERPDIAGLQQPASLRILATRQHDSAYAQATGEDARLALTLDGTVAGLKLATVRPLRLDPEGRPDEGELRAAGADLGPFLTLAGAAALAPGPWPAELTLALARADNAAGLRASLRGQIAGASLSADLRRADDGPVTGSVSLARLSLPQLAAALPVPDRAVPAPPLDLDLRAGALDLGLGLSLTGAGLKLAYADGDLGLRDLGGRLAEGRLTGTASLARRAGGLAVSGEGTLEDASLQALARGPLSGRLSAKLRFGTSGADAAALAANLAGSGTLTLTDLSVPDADPAALGRALGRALEADDPLREGRLPQIVGEELGRAAAQARGSVSAPATIIGGIVRAGPLDLDLGPARWSGSLAYDLGAGRLDARGTLAGGAPPRGWSAGTPVAGFGLAGPLGAPERSLDTGPLATGLAAVVLQRELERIELLEADQVERQRRRARIELDQARAAALKAAAEAEEAARQARAKAQQAAAEEAARQARAREAEEAAREAARRSQVSPPAEAVPEGSPAQVQP